MQGYIININQVKDEDLIVTILTQNNCYTTYRFYGARHSVINIGYKIDFELESNHKSNIYRLKDVLQIGYSWIVDNNKLYCWQRFIKLFYPHLKDVEDIDSFYFELLDNLVHKITKQNSKRAIIESYILLCKHEGRLHSDFVCLLCDKDIDSIVSLVRGFFPVHGDCCYGKKFDLYQIKELCEENGLMSFSDEDIEYIWLVLLQGL